MKGAPTLLFTCVLLSAGCYSLTNFQSPEVLPPRAWSLTLGAASKPEVAAMARYGLFHGVDVGGKLSLPHGALTADVKWQVLRHPLCAAADFGASYGHRVPTLDTKADQEFITFYPELLVGTNRLYAAVRTMKLYTVEHRPRSATSSKWCPEIFVGASFGGNHRVICEGTLTCLGEWPRLTPGLGVAYQYRP
jgi:hypothetical protein